MSIKKEEIKKLQVEYFKVAPKKSINSLETTKRILQGLGLKVSVDRARRFVEERRGICSSKFDSRLYLWALQGLVADIIRVDRAKGKELNTIKKTVSYYL